MPVKLVVESLHNCPAGGSEKMGKDLEGPMIGELFLMLKTCACRIQQTHTLFLPPIESLRCLVMRLVSGDERLSQSLGRDSRRLNGMFTVIIKDHAGQTIQIDCGAF